MEVEAYENEVELLLSVHKEITTAVDWHALACALPRHPPFRIARHELIAVTKRASVEEGRQSDEREYQAARDVYEQELSHCQKLRSLARHVLDGDPIAYREAVAGSSSLAEISNLGSSIQMTVHDAKTIECELKVCGRNVIPAEAKSLTTNGKLVVKAIPNKRFYEIYQDYVCSCVLRLAREMFALLPVHTVLLTAVVDDVDSSTGHTAEFPVLSVVAKRTEIEHLDYEHIDPSDAIENFQHRGDALTSRRSGNFIPIIPLTPADVTPLTPEFMDFLSLLNHAKSVRSELVSMFKPIADTMQLNV